MKKTFYFLFSLVFTSFFFSSCGNKESKEETSVLEDTYTTNEDSIAVVSLLEDFMNTVRQGDYEAACDMLYWVDPKNDEQFVPLPLTEKRKAEAIRMMEMFPCKGYKIEDVIYDQFYDNQAAVRVWFGDDDRMTTVWYFKPVRQVAKWFLCLRNTSDGDRPLNKN